ncbi:MAG: molybdenum cofactor biosynthesis protein MoaE [Planctomycetes bacterium]|nr:molybdenum cofactor biosynthesis protein MoaE [Planctomycetota bacterium]
MRVVVLLFASLPEIAGTRRLELDLENGATLASVRALLIDRWPAVARIPFVFARNRAYAAEETPLSDGDEIACVPAISGGDDAADLDVPRTSFAFTSEGIDPRILEQRVRRDHDGAIVTFHGVTRDHHDGRAVRGLAYEAYEPMAIEKALEILDEVVQHHDVGRIHVVHRLGPVAIGEASIVVVVGSAHRGPSFDAARDVMDRIKREVPIFKKETYEDREHRWVGDLPHTER